MSKRFALVSPLALAWLLIATAGLTLAQGPGQPRPVAPLDTSFTYQGRLDGPDGRPVAGLCNFHFGLWDDPTAGSLAGEQTVAGVSISGGYFTVLLDLGPFSGEARWLEIAVQCGADPGYTTLSPRQALTGAPQALYALAAPWTGLAGLPPGFADDIDNNTTYTAGAGLVLTGTAFLADPTYLQRRVADACPADSAIRAIDPDGAVTCQPIDSGPAAWLLAGNAGTDPAIHMIGTTDAVSLTLAVSGTAALRIYPTAYGVPNLIGGWSGNRATPNTAGATIAGGGYDTGCGDDYDAPCPNLVSGGMGTVVGGKGNQADAISVVGGGVENTAGPGSLNTVVGGWGNRAGNTAGYQDLGTVGGGSHNAASGNYSTVVGGDYCTAGGMQSTVGGGQVNTAGGEDSTVAGGSVNTAGGVDATVVGGAYNNASGYWSTVAGGSSNDATQGHATVVGGLGNTASGLYATVGGGRENTATGEAATIAGGEHNAAAGYAFAAGRRAKASQPGCFAWGDSTDADVTCDAANRWVARASGGVYFYTSGDLAAGVYVPAGGGSWSSVSDRALKDNVSAVDGRDVLARLANLPINTWSYKSQDPAIRHIGPMAQDFYAAFGVGEDDTHISSVDADGVALAAIQGLAAENQALQAQVESLTAANQALSAEVESLKAGDADVKARPAALEQARPASRPLPLSWLLGGLVVAGGALFWKKGGRPW